MESHSHHKVGLALTVVLFATWACGRSSSPTEQPQVNPTSPKAATATSEPAAAAGPTVTATGVCQPPTPVIQLGEVVEGEIVGSDEPFGEKQYYCVDVPDGLSSITAELTGMTADLNLYMASPELDNVIHGGFWYWEDTGPGTDTKSVTAAPGVRDYVWRGSYYIEVSAEDYHESSPFSLTVTGQ
ncbi:MAG: hypothetical protein WBR18_08775 [Anaerolineales bacterium]